MNPAEARRSSVKQLFKEQNFVNTLNDVGRYREYFFALQCYEELNGIERTFSKEKQNKFGLANYGYALRYGKFAVVSACRLKYEDESSLERVNQIVSDRLDGWLEFEGYISTLSTNTGYFVRYYDEEEK